MSCFHYDANGQLNLVLTVRGSWKCLGCGQEWLPKTEPKCCCGEPKSPGTHRTDGPCYQEPKEPEKPLRYHWDERKPDAGKCPQNFCTVRYKACGHCPCACPCHRAADWSDVAGRFKDASPAVKGALRSLQEPAGEGKDDEVVFRSRDCKLIPVAAVVTREELDFETKKLHAKIEKVYTKAEVDERFRALLDALYQHTKMTAPEMDKLRRRLLLP